MLRLLLSPESYEILPLQLGQNPYLRHKDTHLPNRKACKQHANVAASLVHTPATVHPLPDHHVPLSDIVFVANGGLSLPHMSRPTVLLPNMKYPHRRVELSYLVRVFDELGVSMLPYPGVEPFEGQAELKWFHGGKKAICGYGQRATKKAFEELDAFFESLYGKKGKPELLCIHLISPTYYHLDVAMLEYDDSKCVIHRKAVTPSTLRRIESFLGKENVTVIDTPDSFCLNAVVDGPNLITHSLHHDPSMKPLLERVTGRRVHEVNTSEFERSGGSVRCMIMDLHLPSKE